VHRDPNTPATLGDVDRAVDQLAAATKHGFDGVDCRFDAVDRRFEAIDRRFEAIDRRFDAVDARFDAIDARFDRLEANIPAWISSAVNVATDRFLDHFRVVTDEIKALSGRVTALERRARRRR
jgi:hypothetical protein